MKEELGLMFVLQDIKELYLQYIYSVRSCVVFDKNN